jgi:hypothetical protein
MNIAQGTALIVGTLGRKLSGTEEGLAKRLCQAVGGHPLALELAAARIKGDRPWDTLIEDLTDEIARLEVLDKPHSVAMRKPESDPARRKQNSVIASLTLSVRDLPRFGQQLLAWLGVVFEDARITPSMSATLWSTEEGTASEYLRDLAGAGLLRASDEAYRIHDLMHNMARTLLTAAVIPSRPGEIPGFELDLDDARRQFLENYRAKTTNRLWHTLPDDGYIHDHLVRHFEQACSRSDLDKLLWEENVDGHCGWYDACERLGQIAGFLSDVERVWAHADRVFAYSEDIGNRSQAVALQIHCALIIASINSLSLSIPVPLLVGAVRSGHFTLPQGLALARQLPVGEPRVRALCALGEFQPNQMSVLRAEALAAARRIGDAEARSGA